MHTTGIHGYVNTANTGLNSLTAYSTITTNFTASDTDTLTFNGNLTAGLAAGALVGSNYSSIAAGVAAQLAVATIEIGKFTVTGITGSFYFSHGDTSTSLSANDSLVLLVGQTGTPTAALGVVTLIH